MGRFESGPIPVIYILHQDLKYREMKVLPMESTFRNTVYSKPTGLFSQEPKTKTKKRNTNN